jgi:hypothetical protein
MLAVEVPAEAVFDGKAKRRMEVVFDGELRGQVERLAARMHEIERSRRTPAAVYANKCGSCSMKPVCLPAAIGSASAAECLRRCAAANLRPAPCTIEDPLPLRNLLNTLYVTVPHAYLSKEGETVLVRVEQETLSRVPVHTLEGIVCVGLVSISPALMGFCAESRVGVSFLTEHGRSTKITANEFSSLSSSACLNLRFGSPCGLGSWLWSIPALTACASTSLEPIGNAG